MTSNWPAIIVLRLHIFSYVVGTLSMLLAFFCAVLIAVQDYCLKQKVVGCWIRRWPSLQALDLWLLRFMLIGFPLLTLGLVLGLVLAHFGWSRRWSTEPKVFFGLLAWLWYALLLQTRLVFGWRGRRLAILNMICFAIVILAWLSVYHMVHRGWMA